MDGCSYYRRRVTTRPVLPYDDRGEGPALFFVHGFLNDASVWTAVIDELETDFRCIAVDLPGHGRSPGNGAGTYGRDLVLGDLRAVMDETECGPVVMVGHSLGGYLSLAMAIEDPHRVTGLAWWVRDLASGTRTHASSGTILCGHWQQNATYPRGWK